MKDNKMKADMMFCCLVMALIGAAGIICTVIFIFAIDFNDCNSTFMVLIYSILSGLIWGLLLYRNC